MSDSARNLILQDPTNAIGNFGEKTGTDKPWARHYHPIKSTIPHTFSLDGFTHANFEDAFIGMMDDDDLRLAQPAFFTNKRYWDFDTEADCENWFHTEITSVVLSAWHAHPTVVQTSHTRPPSEENIAENVDCTFSVTHGEKRYTVAIGEFKRNLIDEGEWRDGSITKSGQHSLSRELRGYASKYKCPQVFCFDGARLILLQFRANSVQNIEDETCAIDCWMIPVKNSSCSLRFALYRLLVQGWRRCQGEISAMSIIGGLQMDSREFYTGMPIWNANGQRQKSHPAGYQRSVDQATGALMWSHAAYGAEWETGPFW